MRIGPTIRLAVNAGLRVGAAVGSLEGIDTALVAPGGLLDTPAAVDSGSGKPEIDDDDRADDIDRVVPDDGESWQHRKVSSGCIAGRIGGSYKDYGTLEANVGGRVAEVAE